MTPKELGELGHLEAASPVVDVADFPPVEADEALEPGQRKSINILREFASTPRDRSFGNGRFARNVLEAAIGRHAWRLRDVRGA